MCDTFQMMRAAIIELVLLSLMASACAQGEASLPPIATSESPELQSEISAPVTELPSSPANCPANVELANLIASSDQILIGTMTFSARLLAEEASNARPDYFEIPVEVETWLKGGDAGRVSLRFYPVDAPYKPSNAAMSELAGSSAILFLTQVDEGPVGLYFAGHSPEALQSSSPSAINAVRTEVSRQIELQEGHDVDPTLPHFQEVTRLIAQLGSVRGPQQQHVFDSLVRLGPEAVPAIVTQMDVRRPLLTRAISLENRAPDAFEAVRHYGPDQVVDGLDAVLNQITGAGFGSIANGGTDRQRDATVAGWRVFASNVGCT